MGDLDAPAARVRALLEGVFGPVTAIGDSFVAQRRDCLATGAALTQDRLSGLRDIIWHRLSLLPAADGAGIVAARGVVGGKDRHLEWWQRTAHGDSGTAGFARIRLNLDPESVDLYDYLDMDWFTIPLRERRPYVYGPHVDFSCADRYVVTMTVPVTDASSRDHGSPDQGTAGEGAGGEREFLGVAGADIRMSHLEPELLAILRSVPSPAVLVTAERRVVAANTPHWISGTRLPRLPAAGDRDFAAVTEIGAHSGWLLAATRLPRPPERRDETPVYRRQALVTDPHRGGPRNMTTHVAIAGGGLGGLRAAEQLRAAGHAGPITVIGAEPHMPYNRPPLSKELLAHELADAEATPETDADNLAALHERIAFRRRASVADVTFRLGVPVTGVDLSGGELALADGDAVLFDGLVIATGLRPRRLRVPGPAGPGSGRHVLRTLDDCASLRAGLRAALARPAAAEPGCSGRPHVVVVGAGFIGCEVACTALSLGCDVTVVEPAGPPMFRVLGGALAQAVQRAHELAGITFVLGRAVVAYAGRERVTGVVLADGADTSDQVPGGPALAGAVLPADLVVEAIGSLPNTEWLAGSGLDLTDGVLCDNTLSALTVAGSSASVTSAPVTAVGDVARFPNPLLDDVPRRVEHWSMPTDTARRAAATLHAKLAGDPIEPNSFRPLPYFWSDQGDLRLQSYGNPGLADDVVIAEGDPEELDKGLVATYHRDGRLVGSVAFNLPPTRYRELREALTA